MNASELTSSHPIFKDFTEEELVEIQQVADKQEIEAQVDIIKESEKSDDFFVILSGKADILKIEEDEHGTQQQFKLATISKGDVCGEVAFIDHLPRSSTVRTIEPTKVLRINRNSILTGPHGKKILDKLIRNISKTSIKRLREFNNQYLNSLQITFNLVKHRQDFGLFFIVVFTALILITISEYTVRGWGFALNNPWFSMARLLLVCVPSFYWIKKFHLSLQNFGIFWQDWKISVIEGSVLGLFFAILITYSYSLYGGVSLYNTLSTIAHGSLETDEVILYPISSYLQEFIARGIVQSSIQRFLNDKRGFYAVFVTAILFSGIHIHQGWLSVIILFIGSFILGLFYLHRQNLIGVATAHMIIGYTYLPLLGKY